MPRYYFDFSENDGHPIPDPEGTDLPDTHAAHTEAAASLGEMVKDVLRNDGGRHQLQIAVRDENGSSLFRCILSFDTIPHDVEKMNGGRIKPAARPEKAQDPNVT
jgi:hypothetical protein